MQYREICARSTGNSSYLTIYNNLLLYRTNTLFFIIMITRMISSISIIN